MSPDKVRLFYSILLAVSLFSITISAFAISDCPSTCTCTQNLQTLILICNSATTKVTLPSTSTTSSLSAVTKIALTGSTLTDIPSDLCGYQYYLNSLDLSSNRLRTSLNSTHFMCLGALSFLNLSNNRITDLDSSTFDYQTMLVTLDLSNNLISSLPTNLFAASNLSSNPKLRKLKYLYLQNNRIVQLDPWYFYLQSIVVINMARNEISNFTNRLAVNMSQEVVDLQQVKTLQQFDLADNNIQEFDDFILGKLKL